MTPIRWFPDQKILREFSEAGMFALGMVAAPLAYSRGQFRFAATLWVLAVTLRIIGLARPLWLKKAFIGLSLLTWPIGWLISRIALAILFFAVFTPIALIFRLFGRDVLHRNIDRDAETYWELYRPSRGIDRYLRPF